MFIAISELFAAGAHSFHEKLNKALAAMAFDRRVEEQCSKFDEESIYQPGIHFRMLLIGYFEGIDLERGIAWRVADSLSLRNFLHYALFRINLQVLREADLLKGKTIGVAPTTLEANAAMRSIMRKDNGQRYQVYLELLAKNGGLDSPTKNNLAKLDRKRSKKGSNNEWASALVELQEELGLRTYVSEPERLGRKWEKHPAAQKAVYANRRRIKGERGKALLRQRGEKLNRSNAHICETGGMRRRHLRGRENILKQLIVHAAGFNLGVLRRAEIGIGKPPPAFSLVLGVGAH